MVCYLLIIFIFFFGNGLVCLVICFNKGFCLFLIMFFIFLLVCCDLFIVSLVMLFDVENLLFNGVWWYGEIFCIVWIIVYFFSVFILILIFLIFIIDCYKILSDLLRRFWKLKFLFVKSFCVVVLFLWCYFLVFFLLFVLGWRFYFFYVIGGYCYFNIIFMYFVFSSVLYFILLLFIIGGIYFKINCIV